MTLRTGLEPDVAELVAGGVALGRTARRRRRAGTALGAVAMGVVGSPLAVAPGLGGSEAPEQGTVADQSSDKPKPTQPERQAGPTPDAALAVAAADVPAKFERAARVGRSGACAA